MSASLWAGIDEVLIGKSYDLALRDEESELAFGLIR
jgi:hypothetical protein